MGLSYPGCISETIMYSNLKLILGRVISEGLSVRHDHVIFSCTFDLAVMPLTLKS